MKEIPKHSILTGTQAVRIVTARIVDFRGMIRFYGYHERQIPVGLVITNLGAWGLIPPPPSGNSAQIVNLSTRAAQ